MNGSNGGKAGVWRCVGGVTTVGWTTVQRRTNKHTDISNFKTFVYKFNIHEIITN